MATKVTLIIYNHNAWAHKMIVLPNLHIENFPIGHLTIRKAKPQIEEAQKDAVRFMI